jgi:hypothetical protein
MIDRYVTTLFCDDIRFELGNKQSYIGVYYGKMLVPQFPLQLPKLCIAIAVHTPVNKPFKKITFRVLKGDTTLGEILLDDSVLSTQVVPASSVDYADVAKMFSANTIVVLAPFPIEGPTMLRIRVQTESEELRGPGLEIEMPGTIARQQPALTS